MDNPIASQIDKWPALGVFAKDAGVSYGAAKQMRRRGSIPVQHWPAILASETARGIGLTAEFLMEIHTHRAQAAE